MQKVYLALLFLAIANGQYLANNLVVVNSAYYDIDIDFSADIGYYTTYGASASNVAVTQSYGLRFYSILNLNIA